MFVLNPQLGTPIYRQLVEQVTRMVAGGQLQSGESLPSVRELAGTHAVNPMTISKAYGILEKDGILVRLRGKPMQVAEISATHTGQSSAQLLQEPLQQLAEAAGQLDLNESELVQILQNFLQKKSD